MFKVGDRVKIVRKMSSWKMESGFNMNTWTDSMDDFIGGEWIIEWIGEREFRIEGSIYNFPIECADLAEDTTNHHPHHDLIIAWAKGAEIQWYCDELNKWMLASTPEWHSCDKYRIKPTNPDADRIARIESEMRRLADELKELRDE